MENREHLIEHSDTHLPCSSSDYSMKTVKGYDFEIKVDVSFIECKVCSEKFSNVDEICYHLANKHKMPYEPGAPVLLSAYRLIDFKCLICDENLKYFSNLVKHMNSEHPINYFQCNNCHQTFNKKKDLHSHIRHHHKDEYRCPKCSKIFSSHSELIRHKTKDHISQCNLCFTTFSSFKMRLKHMKGEHDIAGGGTCGFCSKEFNTKNGFLDHAAKCTVGSVKKAEDAEIVKDKEKQDTVKGLREKLAYIFNNTTVQPFKFFHNRFRCFYCPKECNKWQDLRSHTNAEHPVCDVKMKCMTLKTLCPSKGFKLKVDVSTMQCKLCLFHSTQLDTLLTHLETEHEAKLTNCLEYVHPFKLIQDRFPCTWCEKEFRHFGLTLKHVNTEHTGNKFLCVYCGRPFLNDFGLRVHVARYHLPDYRFKCTKCDLSYRTQRELNEHMGAAHGLKVIKCSQCTQMFVSYYAKILHVVQAHNGGHNCSFCGSTFTTYTRMNNHVRRVHFNEKNVSCTLCDKTFFDTQRLKHHMIVHMGERSFRCDYCGKQFLRKKNLIGHISIHVKNPGFSANGENQAVF